MIKINRCHVSHSYAIWFPRNAVPPPGLPPSAEPALLRRPVAKQSTAPGTSHCLPPLWIIYYFIKCVKNTLPNAKWVTKGNLTKTIINFEHRIYSRSPASLYSIALFLVGWAICCGEQPYLCIKGHLFFHSLPSLGVFSCYPQTTNNKCQHSTHVKTARSRYGYDSPVVRKRPESTPLPRLQNCPHGDVFVFHRKSFWVFFTE